MPDEPVVMIPLAQMKEIEGVVDGCIKDKIRCNFKLQLLVNDFNEVMNHNLALKREMKEVKENKGKWLGVPGWGWLLIGALAGGGAVAITVAVAR